MFVEKDIVYGRTMKKARIGDTTLELIMIVLFAKTNAPMIQTALE